MPRKTDPDEELAKLKASPGPRTFAFRCPDGLAAGVFRACKALGMDPSDVLRAVVERHLDEYVRSPGASGARAVALGNGLRVTLEPGADKAHLLEAFAERLAAGERAVVLLLPGELHDLARAAGEGLGSDDQHVLAQVVSLHLPAFAERVAEANQERATAAGALRRVEASSPSQVVQRLAQVGREARGRGHDPLRAMVRFGLGDEELSQGPLEEPVGEAMELLEKEERAAAYKKVVEEVRRTRRRPPR